MPTGNQRAGRSRPSPIIIALVVCVLAALAGGAYVLTRPAAAPTPSKPPAAAPVATKKPAAAPSKPAAPSAAPRLKAVKAAALAAGWARVRGTVTMHGHTVTTSGTAGVHDGIQLVVNGASRSTIEVIDFQTFIRANAAAKADFQTTAGDARIWAGHWLRLVSGDNGYDEMSSSVTLGSGLDTLTLGAPLVLLPTRTVNGHKVFGLRGTLGKKGAGTATLWVAADGPPLPVSYAAASADRSQRATVTWDRWGKALDVSEPDAGDVVVTKLHWAGT